jgi:hypothetical protein
METIDNNVLELKYLEQLLSHINLVQQNAIKIAKILLEEGKHNLAKNLLKNVASHDASKFVGIEWDYLKVYAYKKKLNKQEKTNLMIAIQHHCTTNPHHPEYWNGIHNMPELYLIELTCDWRARAIEFGTDLRDWIHEHAFNRYNFNEHDHVYGIINKYLSILCNKQFAQLSNNK